MSEYLIRTSNELTDLADLLECYPVRELSVRDLSTKGRRDGGTAWGREVLRMSAGDRESLPVELLVEMEPGLYVTAEAWFVTEGLWNDEEKLNVLLRDPSVPPGEVPENIELVWNRDEPQEYTIKYFFNLNHNGSTPAPDILNTVFQTRWLDYMITVRFDITIPVNSLDRDFVELNQEQEI